MHQVRQHLEKTILGKGVPAALTALQHLYGMTTMDIAWALDRDRTMVSLYVNGRAAMPERVKDQLADVLKECMMVAKAIPTRQESEEELLEAIIARTQAILESL